MSGIWWLASYPKSGNTWLRIFLSNFLYASEKPASINGLPLPMTSVNDRAVVDRMAGLETSDLTSEELNLYQTDVCRRVALESSDTLYIKTHNAYLYDLAGEPLIPSDTSRGAVYIARNPLDIAVSFAHHLACSIDDTIRSMGDPNFALNGSPTRIHRTLKQPTLSWSGHVESWLNQSEIPIHVMRYEDMLGRPHDTFASCVRFLGLASDVSQIARALDWSSFETLRGQELLHGFKERHSSAKVFFRKGQSRQWHERLTSSQISSIVGTHGEAMARLGYSSE